MAELLHKILQKGEIMSGILYGIGVGPGDGQLLTIRAYRLLTGAKVIAVPVKKYGESSRALNIIRETVDVAGKTIVELEFPMARQKSVLEESHKIAARKISAWLDQGEDVMLITLGDVSVYSTCTYVLDKIRQMGYPIRIIPGIPSFCSGAALAGLSLAEGDEKLAVLSSLGESSEIEKILDDFDNVVLMKAGRQMENIEKILEEKGLLKNATVICNAGMEDMYIGPVDGSREYGYFTTLIVKKGSREL